MSIYIELRKLCARKEFQSFWEMSRNKDWIISLFISILSYKALPFEASKKESQGILCLYT